MKRFKYMALAALVAFAACDEGGDVIVPVDVTGDIAGVVTIEGAAVSGVTVTLSSGVTTTTDGSGAYSFADVAAGAYTITISGFAADATFSSTSKAATIVTTGQVATVNFDGAYIRTSAILGSVAAGGKNLSGVNVSIGSSTTQTDSNGQYSFSGLRAGTYTVTVSGFNAQQYAFATSTQNVTLGVGESKVVRFDGQLLATSTISGTLYIDGNGNLSFDTGEPAVAKAGITVALERAIGDTIYTTTDANGAYAFADLEEGTYKVILLPQAAFPGAFAQSGDMRYLAVATSGAATTVNFAFVVARQYVNVYGMLGIDGVNVGVAPIASWTVTLYPTEVDATAGTNKLNSSTVKTDASGLAKFSFLRSSDFSPNAAVADGIVFAKVAAPTASYSVSGETIIEIPWLPMDSIVMAPDTFDATFNSVVVKVHVNEIDLDTLAGWDVQARAGKDTLAAAVFAGAASDVDGDVYFTLPAPIAPNTYPDTAFFRLGNVQAGPTHPWTSTANGGTAVGRYLRVIWDGTVPPTDTLIGGIQSVKYTTVDIKVQLHRELDDTLGYTKGDNLVMGGGSGIDVNLRSVTSSGTTSVSTLNAANGVGLVTFPGIAITKSYVVRARSLSANYDVLNDTSIAIVVDGSDETVVPDVLKGSKGSSAFMVKRNNNELDGRVKSRLGASPVAGAIVTVTPAANNIQGTASKVDTTEATLGAYDFTGLRDGPYIVTVSTGDSAWTFLRKLKTTDGVSSGTANNDSPSQGTRDLSDGPGAGVSRANFEAYRTDVKFSGLVVNDRDTDLTTVDPGEALAGAIINLYRDDDGSATAGTDTLAASDTTTADGQYSFTGLVEGRFTAVWVAGTPNTDVQVLRALSTTNVPTTKVTATPVFGANVAAAGSLPAWNYADPSAPSNVAPVNFAFLHTNTVVKGKVTKFTGGAAVAGMQIQLEKCYLSTANTFGSTLTNVSGPQPDDGGATTCTTVFVGGTSNTTTDSSGNFEFPPLREGVYRVTPLVGTVTPAFAGYTGVNTSFVVHVAPGPAGDDNKPGLFLTVSSGDIEALDFVVW